MTWADDVTVDIGAAFGDGALEGNPNWFSIIDDVRGFTIKRGRTSLRQDFDAGILDLVVDNRSGNYDPENTAGLYYPSVRIHTPVAVSAEYDSTCYDLFWGHVAVLPLLYPDDIDGLVEMECTDNLPLLARHRLQAQDYSADTTDGRIDDILDSAGWAAGLRALASGVEDCAAITDFSGDALSLIRRTNEVEQGTYFISGAGDFTFLNRVNYSGASASDTFGTSNLAIQGFSRGYDDRIMVNLAEVTGADDDPQTAEDTTSSDLHGVFDFVTDNNSIPDAAGALNIAEWTVGVRADYQHRVGSFTVYPQVDPTNLFPVVLGAELGDLIAVTYTPPGGDAYTSDVVIDQIIHRAEPGLWTTSFKCHPLSTFESQTYWTLGATAGHKLDTDTRLA